MSDHVIALSPRGHPDHHRGFVPSLTLPSPERPEQDTSSTVLMRALNGLNEGVIVVSPSARIRYANDTAHQLFTAGSLMVRHGTLCGRASGETRDLHSLIAAQANRPTSDAYFRTRKPGSQHPIVLTLSGLEEAAPAPPSVNGSVLILARDLTAASAPSARMIALIFDLTPAEARLANEMIQGDGLQAVALRLGITPNTARTHLNRVFDKTGTKRQAELVRLLLGCGCRTGKRRSAHPESVKTVA